jgi:hypothetical protein
MDGDDGNKIDRETREEAAEAEARPQREEAPPACRSCWPTPTRSI